jgi:hypothetical protein
MTVVTQLYIMTVINTHFLPALIHTTGMTPHKIEPPSLSMPPNNATKAWCLRELAGIISQFQQQ